MQTPDPDTYKFVVKRTRSGVRLKVEVSVQKTQWELYHSEIKKKGKGFQSAAGLQAVVRRYRLVGEGSDDDDRAARDGSDDDRKDGRADAAAPHLRLRYAYAARR